MKNNLLHILLVLSLPLLTHAQSPETKVLWEIGRPDSNITEFAQASNPGDHFIKDGFFLVGKSREATDWPYSQAGPVDIWAGGRSHTYSILFGLKSAPSAGTCRLDVHLIDVGPTNSQLDITINSHSYRTDLPTGAARSIYGDPAKGHHANFSIEFPAAILTSGNNRIGITTTKGSWIIYDWIGLTTPAGARLTSVRPSITIDTIRAQPFVTIHEGHNYQSAVLSLLNTGDSTNATVTLPGQAPQSLGIATGSGQQEIRVPEVTRDSSIGITLQTGNKKIASTQLLLHPVRKMTIYILPHSHNDIGYTEIQTNVEKKQINNLLNGIEYAKRTKDYPAGARFVWNLEGGYAADLFLQRMNEDQKKDFYQALKDGGVALNGMYVNTLTGLCRPEELLNLFRFSTTLGQQAGVKVDAAMISDVPGYTWGTVTAMAQAGIKYFSAAPNYFDRIGDILVQWEDKPFYWVSPSGKEKLLVWIPYKGYALSHGLPGLSKSFVASYMSQLEKEQFPYDISYIRWSGHGDNAVPEIAVSDFVKEWNTTHAWPKFIISSTSTAFHAFEEKYGDRLPRVAGDWTGYWEDGAGSSAYETAENRATSSRLTQAETLWAMGDPGHFPADSFKKAWQHVILYSEHTWGADESITRPLSQKTKEQWEIKKSYATLADSLSHQVLRKAAVSLTTAPTHNSTKASTHNSTSDPSDATSHAIDILNTNSWQRTSLVLLTPELSRDASQIKDDKGNILTSQRLSTGELAFIAQDVPPFSSRQYFLTPAQPAKPSPGRSATSTPDIRAGDHFLDNGLLHVGLDPHTGAITSLHRHDIDNDFVDSAAGDRLNEYLFLNGNNLANLQHNGQVNITVKEKGPVLAILRLESTAPGCNKYSTDIQLVAGMDYVSITNTLDKKPAELNPHPGDYAWANIGGKESLNFGFPFHVSHGDVRLDIPMAIMQPEKDQIPGSCKNWLEVGNWADVSNKDLGITWVSPDAPLVEVGGITATLLGGQTNPAVWRKKIEPTQKLYSWALNNHWETNYRAYQDGIISFRYMLQPHHTFDPLAATRFATGLTQPLIAVPATAHDHINSLLQLTTDRLVTLVLKPSLDGKAWIVTLFNPTDQPQSTSLQWSTPVQATYYSNTDESVGTTITGPITVDPKDVVTVRVER